MRREKDDAQTNKESDVSERLGYSQARVQFIALRDEIKGMLEAGYTVREIYRRLRARGAISMSCATLYYCVKKMRREGMEHFGKMVSPSSGKRIRDHSAPPIPGSDEDSIIKRPDINEIFPGYRNY